jgi:hypothetical protein
MVNPVAGVNIGAAAPQQVGGRNVVQLNQAAPQVVLQALDQARADHIQVQGRLEAQVQQGEVALFQAAQRNAELDRQLNQTVREAQEQRNRANGLDAQLAIERQERANLAALLRQSQALEHVLRGQAANATRLKDDIQRRFDASEVRVGALEQQVINERDSARRRDQLKDYQISKARLEKDIESVENPQITALISGTLSGLFMGGILGGFIGFGGSLGACFVSPCAKREAAYRKELVQVNKEIARLTQNGAP